MESVDSTAQKVDGDVSKPAVWPMPAGEFLRGPYLNRADIILTRKHRDFRSWLIRWATQGSFSHAALIFLVPHQEQGFNNTFVIESSSKGVDLSNLAGYLNDKRQVVGIKRLRGTWFDKRAQSLVRGRMLNSIESAYSYATVFRLGWAFFNELVFGIKARIWGASRAIKGHRRRRLKPPNAYICSGLVQLGYLNAIAEQVSMGYLLPQRVGSVVFQKEVAGLLPDDWSQFSDAEQYEIMWDFVTGFQDVLEAITPEDIAASPQLEWVYVIRDGMVHPVHSNEQAQELLAWEPQA
ncbi:MAG: hypothetical protein KJ622_00535 [Alphaproteobacteria bacterium]|nr:hypothetical protein [Alphaproteobacteria bacterium]